MLFPAIVAKFLNAIRVRYKCGNNVRASILKYLFYFGGTAMCTCMVSHKRHLVTFMSNTERSWSAVCTLWEKRMNVSSTGAIIANKTT